MPAIGDIKGFTWEQMFAYTRDIRVRPVSKKLFDVVSTDNRGWSLKTLEVTTMVPGSRIEFVAQRADIYSKGVALGFEGGLTENSPPAALGRALIEHWNRKHRADMLTQGVTDPHLAVLLKSRSQGSSTSGATRPDPRRFTFIESRYPEWDPTHVTWRWSPPGADGRPHVGLNGFIDEEPVLRWHPSGAQLFEIMAIPPEASTFEVEWSEVDLFDWIEASDA